MSAAIWILVGVIIGLLLGAGGASMLIVRKPRSYQAEDTDGTVELVSFRVRVQIIEFGEHPSPDMKFRWLIWPAGAQDDKWPHPLQLGNEPTEEVARAAAQAWIEKTRSSIADDAVRVLL